MSPHPGSYTDGGLTLVTENTAPLDIRCVRTYIWSLYAELRSSISCLSRLHIRHSCNNSLFLHVVMASPSVQPMLDPNWVAETNLARSLAVTGIFNILALTSVSIHLYARIGLLRTPGRDDFMMVLAIVSIPFFDPKKLKLCR